MNTTDSIFTIYYTDKPGGLCKRLYRLADALGQEELSFTFLSLDPEKLKVSNNVQTERIPFPLSSRSGVLFWVLFTLWVPLYLLWWGRSGKAARAFTFNPYYSLLIAPLRFFGVTKHLTSFYRSVGSRTYFANKKPLLGLIVQLIEKISYRFSDRVVVQTETMHLQLSGNYPTTGFDLKILPNDIPEGCSLSEKSDEPPYLCLAVGMFDKGKNLSLLVEAFHLLKSDSFKLTIIGDGPSLKEIKDRVHALKLSNIEFTGWVNDSSEYFKNGHLLIHPSFNEGMPNVVLEAFGFGLGVLGADTAELREIIGSEEQLFSPQKPEELTALLERYEKEPDYRERVRAVSSEKRSIFSFDWEERAKSFLLE